MGAASSVSPFASKTVSLAACTQRATLHPPPRLLQRFKKSCPSLHHPHYYQTYCLTVRLYKAPDPFIFGTFASLPCPYLHNQDTS
jgi:hypothetical protein